MRWALLLAIAMVAMPTGHAAPLVHGAWLNLYEEVDPRFVVADAQPCASSEVVLTADGFAFRELGAADHSLDRYARGGYYVAGCATARYQYTLPSPDANQVVAHFTATRNINQFVDFAPIDFRQAVLMDGMESPLDIFQPDQGSQPPFYSFEAVGTPVAATGFVEFQFEDRSYMAQESGAATPASGVDAEAYVEGLELEYSLIPADVVSLTTERRAGDAAAVRETMLAISVPRMYTEEYGLSLQVRVDANHAFDHMILPDGSTVRDSSTRSGPGLHGFDSSRVLVETKADEHFHQVTVSKELVALHGPGEYTIVFHDENLLAPSLVLMPLAVGAVILPAGAAGFAGVGVRKLRREQPDSDASFSAGLARGLVVGLVVYAIALTAILFGPGLKGLATAPANFGVFVSYIILFAIASAFVFLWYLASKVLLGAAQVHSREAKEHARELAKSNQDLQEFAQIASHDLKEPLRTIRGYTTLLQRKYKGKLDAQADEFIDFAASGAERMSTLLDGLLEYSGLDMATSRREEVDMQEVVLQARQDLKRRLDEANARMHQQKLPRVLGVKSQLAQIALNLISNAVKFRDAKRPLTIRISVKDEGSLWRFEFRDNGIGMTHSAASRAFEMFYSVDASTKRDGRGVGLAIVRRIVDRHGGTCGITSVIGQGSRVWFTLPKMTEGVE